MVFYTLILLRVRNRLLQSILQQEEDFPYAFNRNLLGGEFKLILLVIIVAEEDIEAIVSLFQPNAGGLSTIPDGDCRQFLNVHPTLVGEDEPIILIEWNLLQHYRLKCGIKCIARF